MDGEGSSLVRSGYVQERVRIQVSWRKLANLRNHVQGRWAEEGLQPRKLVREAEESRARSQSALRSRSLPRRPRPLCWLIAEFGSYLLKLLAIADQSQALMTSSSNSCRLDVFLIWITAIGGPGGISFAVGPVLFALHLLNIYNHTCATNYDDDS